MIAVLIGAYGGLVAFFQHYRLHYKSARMKTGFERLVDFIAFLSAGTLVSFMVFTGSQEVNDNVHRSYMLAAGASFAADAILMAYSRKLIKDIEDNGGKKDG